jgi:hypothetical protein
MNVPIVTHPAGIHPRSDKCCRFGCEALYPKNSIVWRCPNGHRFEFGYCGDHIERMIAIAMTPPGEPFEGMVFGRMLCDECFLFIEPILEGL